MYYALVVFKIFLPFMPMSPNWPLSFRFPDQNFFSISSLLHNTYYGYLTSADCNAIISVSVKSFNFYGGESLLRI